MDPLREDDLERARATSPEERARQALDLMRAGFALKRSALRVQFPAESAEELELRFQRWLGCDDRV